MGRRNSNVICIPIVETVEEKVQRPLWTVDNTYYEEKYGKENVRYDPYPALDENGNEITKYDIYVTKERVRFRYMKRKSPGLQTKLFETYSDIQKRKEEENGK